MRQVQRLTWTVNVKHIKQCNYDCESYTGVMSNYNCEHETGVPV